MKILSTDSRDSVPAEIKAGVYYVTKKRTIAEFRFHPSKEPHATVGEAHKAMREFLDKRKDADVVRVTLIERDPNGRLYREG